MAKSYLIGGDKPTKRMEIMLFLAKCPNGATKREILNAVWNRPYESFNTPYGNTMRGWACTTFREMIEDGRLFYDKHTHKWFVGVCGWEILTQHLLLKIA